MTTREIFNVHTEKWRNETGHFSTTDRKYLHPSYLRIIGLGPAVIPLILEEMQRAAGFWFVALQALTGENPTNETMNFEEATTSWIEWGIERGFIHE